MFPRFWKDETEQQGSPAESTLDHPLMTPGELPVEDVGGSQSSPEEVEIEEGLRRLADVEDRSADPGDRARSGRWITARQRIRSMGSIRICWRCATWPAISSWPGSRSAR